MDQVLHDHPFCRGCCDHGDSPDRDDHPHSLDDSTIPGCILLQHSESFISTSNKGEGDWVRLVDSNARGRVLPLRPSSLPTRLEHPLHAKTVLTLRQTKTVCRSHPSGFYLVLYFRSRSRTSIIIRLPTPNRPRGAQWTNALYIPFFAFINSRMSLDLLELMKRKQNGHMDTTYTSGVFTTQFDMDDMRFARAVPPAVGDSGVEMTMLSPESTV